MAFWWLKWRSGLLALMLGVLIGCAASFTNHGYAPTDTELEEVIVGVDNRASVEESIGRPASTGVLTESGWFYVSSRVRHYTYQAPEVIDRQLVAVTFNKRGLVENIERFTLEDGQVVVLSRRVTRSNIKGVSFIQQMLRNVGRTSLGS